MVFKKPYALLIKNFKLIHIILSAIIVFIISQYSKISGFFSEYTKDGVKSTFALADSYISGFLYLAIILVVIFSLLMLLLMHNKKKPTLFYILTFIYYVILLISVFIASGIMNSLADTTLTQQASRAYRDVYIIFLIIQVYFIIQSVIRAIGFDVKKFGFNQDLAELEIKSEDNEEFEFVLGTDTYLYQRKFRRIMREIKYYALENKLVLSIIGLALGGFLLVYIFLHFNFINKVYQAGESADLYGFNYRLNTSYITAYDYNGNLIKKGKKYVVVALTIRNNNYNPTALDNNYLRLAIGNEFIYNQPHLRNYFIDIGKVYTGETLTSGVDKDLVFVFEINQDLNDKDFTLKILKEIIISEDNEFTYNYSDFKVAPGTLDKTPVRIERNLNELMFLSERLFKDSQLTVSKMEILNKYEYQYEACKNDVCNTYYDIIAPQDPTLYKLLVINYNLTLNKTMGLNASINNAQSFFAQFLKIESELNGKVVTRALVTATYPNLKNLLFVEVPNNLVSDEKFNIILQTRDYSYFMDYSKIK